MLIKSDVFQSDLYPDTVSDQPALTAAEWFGGKTANPKTMSLEKGYTPQAKKEFISTATPVAVEEVKVLNDKEVKDIIIKLR
jgi:coronin-1B/1C/6